MLPTKLAFVDIETTGARLRKDRIIDIGIVRVENGEVVETFSSLVDPGTYLPSEITRLTGITQADLKGAPTFVQIKDKIQELLADCLFVAHNASFDYRFLKTEFKRAGSTFSSKMLCTVKLSRALYQNVLHHNLDSLIERFGLRCEMRHRGVADAQVIHDFYKLMLDLHPLERIKDVIDNVLGHHTLPVNLNLKNFSDLPDSPGVYVFATEDGTPIYIGKSKNIRKRISSHFASSNISPTALKIASLAADIQTHKTAGELGALLLESEMIKKHQPLYNRKLRHSSSLIVAKRKEAHGYNSVSLEDVDTILPHDLKDVLGVFRSKKQAITLLIQLVKNHRLCDKLLGIEKTTRACFGYSLGRCSGACIGLEKPAKFNLRFEEAFAKYKIRSWPFPGSIAIREQDEETGLEEVHFIDQWCYLGKVSSHKDAGQDYFTNETKFDLDFYKILVSFLSNPHNLQYVRQYQPEFFPATS